MTSPPLTAALSTLPIAQCVPLESVNPPTPSPLLRHWHCSDHGHPIGRTTTTPDHHSGGTRFATVIIIHMSTITSVSAALSAARSSGERLIEGRAVALWEVQLMLHHRVHHARYNIILVVHPEERRLRGQRVRSRPTGHRSNRVGQIGGVQHRTGIVIHVAPALARMRIQMVVDVLLHFRLGGEAAPAVGHWAAERTITLEERMVV